MNYFSFEWTSVPHKRVKGQWYFRAPNHPLACQSPKSSMFGWVRAARHIASAQIGRWIDPDEVIRLSDGNPDNLDPKNLELMTRANFQSTISNATDRVLLNCTVCGAQFSVPASQAGLRITCSDKCSHIKLQRFEVTREELFAFIWNQSTLSLAKDFGVSDKAISKRCKRLGIPKPPRGYWRLIELGEEHEAALRRLKWSDDQIDALNLELEHIDNGI